MEKKLADYRAKKARQKKFEEITTRVKTAFSWRPRPKTPETNLEKESLVPVEPIETCEDTSSHCSEDSNIDCCTWADLVFYFLCFLLWATLYAIFIQYQFGTVFLIVSALVFMYVNTRTSPKRSDEPSAYSVFNKNCESIDGTLKAEQFEKEIRYGPTF